MDVSVPCPFDEENHLRLVRYQCSCGQSQPLCRLYFCRYCSELRCGYCVSHEVDSHYCPNCLENMPSAEARLKKNRCANCFDCPSCGNTLSTRATSTTFPSAQEQGKVTSKKVYYLACGFCRWTTRDIGLPDQPTASGGWPEPENSDAARFASLQDHYRSLAQKEKLEKETRRFLGKKLSYMQLADKYGFGTSVARRKAGLPPLHSPSLKGLSAGGDDLKGISVAPSEAKDISEVESEIDFKDVFTDPVDLFRTTRLDQRLMQVDTQPTKASDVYPRHKHLVVKRSQRCRQCEHNLSKPEYNPTSIKFKIQLAAYYHIPEVIIYQLSKEPLNPGKETTFVLKISNPTQHSTMIDLMDISEFQAAKEKVDAAKDEEKRGVNEDHSLEDTNKNTVSASPMSVSTLLKQFSIVKASDRHVIQTNASFVTFKEGLKTYLPPRDDTAEYDETGPDLPDVIDDERFVVWRKSNKVGILAKASVDKDVKSGDEVVVGFGLRYEYTNTLPSVEQKEVSKYDIVIPVFVILGKIA